MTTTTECRSPVYDDPEMWDQEVVGDDMYAYSDNQAYVDPDYSQASQECHLIAGRAVYVNECEVNNDDQGRRHMPNSMIQVGMRLTCKIPRMR
jgi:hypothetical protein